MNLLTIIVLIIFAISILRGYRRGFVKSFASMVSIILSIVLVNIAAPYVTDFLKTQTPVYDYILEKCESAFTIPETEKTSGSGRPAEKNDQTRQNEIIESLKLPQALQNLLKENNTPEYYRQIAAKSFSEYVPKYMASLILNIFSFIATWILVISFIWLAVMTLDAIAGLPVIRGLNQLLGLVLGFFQGLIIVWIAFLIITIFSNSDIGKQLMEMITESPVLSEIYDTNILLDFLQNAVKKFF